MNTSVSIALFGLLGIFSRYGLDLSMSKQFPNFPVGILSINILGSFLAGVIYVLFQEKAILSPPTATGLLVGFCGGFTTFSSYALQAFNLYENGMLFQATLYLVGSPLLGLVGAFLGLTTARFIA